jgi:glycosyltransferase involved in cell wall biosynthesis
MSEEKAVDEGRHRWLDRMLRSSGDKVRQATGSVESRPCCIDPQAIGAKLEVLWSGHLFDYSGYAKANRELLFRVANTFRIQISQYDIEKEPLMVDGSATVRLNAHVNTRVSKRAPLVRFYTPRDEEAHKDRHRICYTMMETEKVHPDFVDLMQKNYNEIWVPTEWNREVFKKGGLTIPCYVMPLGVNPQLFRPMGAKREWGATIPAHERIGTPPESTLLTTKERGKKEKPRGYLFLSLYHPTFRKGTDILLRAFEEAFEGDSEAALVLVTTIHQGEMDPNLFVHLPTGPASGRARVYHCTGMKAEEDLPELYNAFDCYVTASRGEGWNLPATEAVSCGLPIIASKCSSHTELFPDPWGSAVEPDDFRPYPGSVSVCKWYDDMPFANFEKKGVSTLAHFMRWHKANPHVSRNRSAHLSHTIRENYSWDRSAEKIIRRLLEIVS